MLMTRIALKVYDAVVPMVIPVVAGMSESEWQSWIRKNVQAANPLLWVVEKSLACAPRPLRYHPKFGGREVRLLPTEAASALSAWLESIKEQGIGTIACLATPGEMKRYSLVVSPHPDLLSLYKSSGFVVHAHPVEDPAHAGASARKGILEQLESLKPAILSEYRNRTGAMLIHCSGGMDRTAPIAAFVASHSGSKWLLDLTKKL
jgi:Cyclin-dependent kinase inhibitor 3 (CDKN3)